MRRRGDHGQATVELALLMPIVVMLLMAMVQVGLVARDQVVVVNGARAGARAAAVGVDSAGVRQAVVAATGFESGAVVVEIVRRGSRVVVTVRYRSPTDVPLVGSVLGDVELDATVSMRRE